MDYSEKWGKDVDEAVRLALEDLALTEDQVMVTVLEEPTKGFLGLGGKLAKVRVEKIQIEDEAEEDIPSGNRIEKKANRDLRKKKKTPQSDSGSKKDRAPGKERSSGRERAPGRDRTTVKDEDISDFDFSGKPSLSEKPENLVEVEDNEASVFLKDIINTMSLKVDIKTFYNDECIYIEVSGEDAKVVIGKRGQTLDSIQYLTNLVTNKDKESYQRVVIDVEGYRSRREKTLERLAAKLAKKVQRDGRSVKLEPMNPYERKVIHSTLQGVDGITTRSEGEEPYRRVIIEKAK